MIVHSSDGVFAIRQGPWKWIEGVPVDDIKPAIKKSRSAEFQPQLYHLANDPGETKNVLGEHPEVAKQMAALLERYREGGYSRELPPITEKKPVAAALAPLKGERLQEVALAEMPPAPWKATGTWTAREGALWGKVKVGAKQPAGLQGPLNITDGVLQYEIHLRDAGRHSLRIHAQDKGRSFRIVVSPGRVEIAKNPEPGKDQDPVVTLAAAAVKLKREEWHTLRVSFRGDTVTVEVGGATVMGTHALLGEPKAGMHLLVFDGEMGFRNVVVAK
jgi:arylsulfatase A